MVMMVLFVLSAVFIAYTLVMYPAMMWALAHWRTRPTLPPPPDYVPRVTVVVPVYNEARILRRKVANCLAMDYPKDRIQFIFALDGCRDDSEAIIRDVADERIRIRSFPQNRGKVAVLNEVIGSVDSEVVIISDASGMVNPEGVRAVVAPLADPAVGGVGGGYRIYREDRSEMDSAEHSYLGFEMRLRLWEGRYHTTLSGTGSLFAFRQRDFEVFPPGLINEDYYLPARLAIRGFRIIYAAGAGVIDHVSTDLHSVYRRRVRIAYGNWQQIKYLPELLNPFRGVAAWVFISHKLMRMLLPFITLAFMVSTRAFGRDLFWALLLLGAVLLAAGMASLRLDRHFKNINPLSVFPLIGLNFVAVYVGTFKYLAGRKAAW